MRRLPNLICGLRLALAPVCAMAIVEGRFAAALGWFMLAGFTDFADGYLARRFNWHSKLGAILDPLADKALMAAVFIALGAAGVIGWWLVALVFGRDVLILLGAAVIAGRAKIRAFPPSWYGKVSTTIQIVSVTVFIAVAAGYLPDWLRQAGIVATVGGTLVSGFDYAHQGWLMLASSGTRRPSPPGTGR